MTFLTAASITLELSFFRYAFLSPKEPPSHLSPCLLGTGNGAWSRALQYLPTRLLLRPHTSLHRSPGMKRRQRVSTSWGHQYFFIYRRVHPNHATTAMPLHQAPLSKAVAIPHHLHHLSPRHDHIVIIYKQYSKSCRKCITLNCDIGTPLTRLRIYG